MDASWCMRRSKDLRSGAPDKIRTCDLCLRGIKPRMLTYRGCNNGEPAAKLSAIRRQHKNRNDAIRSAYETEAYSYQQIAKEFGVHFTTTGRIVRQPMKRVSATHMTR